MARCLSVHRAGSNQDMVHRTECSQPKILQDYAMQLGVSMRFITSRLGFLSLGTAPYHGRLDTCCSVTDESSTARHESGHRLLQHAALAHGRTGFTGLQQALSYNTITIQAQILVHARLYACVFASWCEQLRVVHGLPASSSQQLLSCYKL